VYYILYLHIEIRKVDGVGVARASIDVSNFIKLIRRMESKQKGGPEWLID
jgi:hypothetical protein